MNANLQRFTGFADTYDRYRPALPLVVRDMLSQLAHGFSEEEIGISDLRKAAEKILADRVVPWWWSYRMRVGIKESAVAVVNEG